MLYVVSYDLKKPGKDYIGLWEQLQHSPNWWHYLESTWLIVTSESPSQVYNRLAAHLDSGDRILIIEAGNHIYGWLSKEAWEWIYREIPYRQS
jgi:hypothetical protein